MDYLEQFWATCTGYVEILWDFLTTGAPALGVIIALIGLLVTLRHQRRKKTQTPRPHRHPPRPTRPRRHAQEDPTSGSRNGSSAISTTRPASSYN